jgi:hypothetical protein
MPLTAFAVKLLLKLILAVTFIMLLVKQLELIERLVRLPFVELIRLKILLIQYLLSIARNLLSLLSFHAYFLRPLIVFLYSLITRFVYVIVHTWLLKVELIAQDPKEIVNYFIVTASFIQ